MHVSFVLVLTSETIDSRIKPQFADMFQYNDFEFMGIEEGVFCPVPIDKQNL